MIEERTDRSVYDFELDCDDSFEYPENEWGDELLGEDKELELAKDQERMQYMINNHDMQKVKDYMNIDDFAIEALGKAYLVRMIEDFKNDPNPVTAERIKSPLFEELYSVFVDSNYYDFAKNFLGKRFYRHKPKEIEMKAVEMGHLNTKSLERDGLSTIAKKKRKELFSNAI